MITYHHQITAKWFTEKPVSSFFRKFNLIQLYSNFLASRFKHLKSWNNYMGKGKVREFEIKKWLVIQTKYEQVF